MNTESTQKKLLEKILNSKEFCSSKIYQTYLTYLFDSAEKGKSLKETTIAIEVFGKDASFNPAEDTTVRSHSYTLRKKLESYYYSEGKEDKIRLKIPKGHYYLQFVPVVTTSYHPKNLLYLLSRKIHIVIIVLLCGVISLLFFKDIELGRKLKKYQIIELDDPIWKEYLKSDLPILLVIGNHFFFNEYDEKYEQTVSIRHPKVNAVEDYQKLFPDKNVVPSPEPYFPYHSIWSLPPVVSILFAANKTPIFRKSSDVTPQILDEYNIIFLGSIKTLYALKHTLLKSHFEFEILPHRIIYSPPNADSTQIFETTLHSEGPNEDLVLALKLPGPVHNCIFIIASYHSLGAPEIAHYLTNVKLRAGLTDQFQQKFHKIPRYFEVLFRVSGIDKTAYNTEILVMDKISEDNNTASVK